MVRDVSKDKERISVVSDLHVKGKGLISDGSKAGDGVAINVRLPRGIVAGIDDWVDEEVFRSRSDFLLAATRHYLLLLADKDIRPSRKDDDQGSL